MKKNSDARWDDFDPESYFKHNYDELRYDDRFILRTVRDYFAKAVPPGRLRGVDVGTGSNLYPALALLPWCDQLTLVDHSARNIAWLEKEVKKYGPAWDVYWDELVRAAPWREVDSPRDRLAKISQIRQGNVFDLPRAQWEIGTMFFVACSLSTDHNEFKRAVHSFLNALRPGAPFAMAYMENSEGYEVNGHPYPAVPIGVDDVHLALTERDAYDIKIDRINSNHLRAGYTGMMVAVGRTGDPD
ncbi:putative N-methyltransferase [Frankia sp. AiPs1]|uniref:SCO2525 family SAM-dependent methyltransferase n=1 Tax=Frankia sp. AiPa1 TaxID=573492 RepID=UPI00202AF5E3|nr:SCO2525 family SAM-dependent methyltransferase [Frankia sp. AiPa1]MCL9758215.1 SCO2525 family SAM-dependent methyltransferase [Frankia sp. AiPa1]